MWSMKLLIQRFSSQSKTWDGTSSLEEAYEGTSAVKEAKLYIFKDNYAKFKIQEDESVSEMCPYTQCRCK
jgi:hypothetical protein